jgi:hypothetical protein
VRQRGEEEERQGGKEARRQGGKEARRGNSRSLEGLPSANAQGRRDDETHPHKSRVGTRAATLTDGAQPGVAVLLGWRGEPRHYRRRPTLTNREWGTRPGMGEQQIPHTAKGAGSG